MELHNNNKKATDVHLYTFLCKLLRMLLTSHMHVNRSKRPSQYNYGMHVFQYTQRVESRSEHHCTCAIETYNTPNLMEKFMSYNGIQDNQYVLLLRTAIYL